jgi:hypothetical protein
MEIAPWMMRLMNTRLGDDLGKMRAWKWVLKLWVEGSYELERGSSCSSLPKMRRGKEMRGGRRWFVIMRGMGVGSTCLEPRVAILTKDKRKIMENHG